LQSPSKNRRKNKRNGVAGKGGKKARCRPPRCYGDTSRKVVAEEEEKNEFSPPENIGPG